MNYLKNKLLLLLSATLLLPHTIMAVEGSLHLAIFPYVVHTRTSAHHKKLTEYLTSVLNMPVSISTVRNPREYIRSIKKGKYDLILTPPHIGRFAQVKAGYIPLAITKRPIQGLYVVRKDSSMKTLADAKHKRISMSSPNAIIHQIAVQDLKNVGIRMGRDIRYHKVRDHNHAVISVAKRTSDIALTGVNVWKKLPSRYKNHLRILEKGTKVPGFLFLANEKVKKNLLKKLKKGLISFDTTNKAQKYIFKGYKPVGKKALKNLDQYTHSLH